VTNATRYAIPEKLNIAIFLVAFPATWGLLWIASHESLVWMLLAAWAFSLVNHLHFSLMHEAVHGVFSEDKTRNDLFGTLSAPAFPTSFTLQKIAHLGHHRRNRTDEELYDYYLPNQSRALRNFQLYAGNLLGFYWACIPVSNLIYLIAPWMYKSRRFIEGPARHLGFAVLGIENLVGMHACTDLPGAVVVDARPVLAGLVAVLLGFRPALVSAAIRGSRLEPARRSAWRVESEGVANHPRSGAELPLPPRAPPPPTGAMGISARARQS
jgi:fatty acid desaturase